MPTQNISLTPELETFVKSQVEGGMFKSASEVHRAALAMMIRMEEERTIRLSALEDALQRGIDDLDEGRTTVLKSEADREELFDSIRRKAIQRSHA